MIKGWDQGLRLEGSVWTKKRDERGETMGERRRYESTQFQRQLNIQKQSEISPFISESDIFGLNYFKAFMEKDSAPKPFDKNWESDAGDYVMMESCPQTFYYTLVNHLKLPQAANVLEIGCGGGLLLPFAVERKSQNTQYVASDLAQAMIKKSEQRLRENFQKYESKLTFEEWLGKQRLILKKINGQELTEEFGKFDRVICNLVLMLTTNSKKMLTSIHQATTEDVIMGITIVGDQEKSDFVKLFANSIKALGLEMPCPPGSRKSPFEYQHQIAQELKETGWEIKFEWQQNAPMPASIPEDINPYLGFIKDQIKIFSEADQARINDKIRETFQEYINAKTPIRIFNRLYIVKKIQS